jgi:hypothetical protein
MDIQIFFFSNESREPAHIHIVSGNNEEEIWLADHKIVYSYGFKAHEIKDLIDLTAEHHVEFMEIWYEYFSTALTMRRLMSVLTRITYYLIR